MLISQDPPAKSRRLRRCASFAAAVALAAGTMAAATAVPAAAKVRPQVNPYQTINLANDPNAGLYSKQGIKSGSPIAITNGLPGYWSWANQSSWSADGVSGTSEELQIDNTSQQPTGLCMGDTGSGVVALSCGANGTYWVQVAHNDGFFFYNRFFLDENNQEVLAVNNPNGDPTATIIPPGQVGGSWWGVWGWSLIMT